MHTLHILNDSAEVALALDQDNLEFLQALEIARSTSQLMFLTGRAGTGKTTFLKYLRQVVKKNTVVLAYTGVAAVNAGGMTIHSFFQINPNDPPFLPDDDRLRHYVPAGGKEGQTIFKYFKYSKAKREIIENLDLLIIDEVSMVRADLIDVIDQILRAFRKKDRRLPFGGVQVIFIGDAFQLAPITGQEWEFLRGYYESPFFFSSRVFAENRPVVVELKKIYRQDQSVEGEFISLLNRVRTNEPEVYDLERLNSKVIDFDPLRLDQGFICLCSENAPANAINQVRLDAIDSPALVYRGSIIDDFKDKNLPNEMNLELKVGAQVMFLKNGIGYYNGKIGRVKELTADSILVELKDDSDKKSVIPVERYEWQNIEYVFNDEKGQIESKVKGKFIQYPLKLAWAITIHKSQGLTFDKVAIDIVYRGDFFKPSGLVYVALSRCRSWDGIVLNRPLNPDSIHVDTRVVEFAKKSTPSTMVDDLIHHGKANECYRRAADAAKAGSFTVAFDVFMKALDFRDDLDRPPVKRLLRRYLNRMESERKELEGLRTRSGTDKQRIDELEATEHRLIDELLEFENKLHKEKKERDALKATIESLQAEVERLQKELSSRK